MTISDLLELIAIIIGLLIILYAIIAFTYRIFKGEPFWPNFKRMLKLLFDGFWGMG